MLTEKQMEEKLRKYAETFSQNVRNREWGKAHNVYNITLETAIMAEMSEGFMKELFGGYDDEDFPLNDGLIKRQDVQKVNTECCIRRNMAYEDITCRKLGIPLGVYRYYSDADYCAMCKKQKK